MKLDIEKWNKVRKEVEAEIKATKKVIRQPFHMGTTEEYRSLESMKWNATTLYAVRAACRGKEHCPTWPKEDAIDKILPQYALPAEEEKPQ